MEDRSIYRNIMESDDLLSFNVKEDESDLWIAADNLIDSKIALKTLAFLRKQIKDYIKKNPAFLRSLSPIETDQDVPSVIKSMLEASYRADVGPMASVAGAIAEEVGRELLDYCSQIIVENGGDLFISTLKPRRVGLYTKVEEFRNLVIKIDPEMSPLGVCSSSSVLGHSLSLGKVDLSLVIAENSYLADAAATSLGNKVKSIEDASGALQSIHSIDGVYAALIVVDGQLNVIGEIEFDSD